MTTSFTYVLIALGFALAGAAAWALYSRRRMSAPASDTAPALTGIGGWLLLVAIGQVLWPATTALQIAESFKGYESAWQLNAPLAVLSLALEIAFLALTLWCSINFFKKRTAFRRLFVWELWLALALPLVQFALVTNMLNVPASSVMDDRDVRDLVRLLVTAAVWSMYMQESVRVRNTFVH